MRKMKVLVGLLVVLSLACAPSAFAAKRDKFGADKRHDEVKKRCVPSNHPRKSLSGKWLCHGPRACCSMTWLSILPTL